jgi:hypothetical protein
MGVRRRGLLHARGQMRGLAHRGVVEVQIGADGAHEDFTGVQTDADRDGRRVLAAERAQGVVHRQRRVAGAHGVILDGDRRPKEGHDAVAHDLIHGAAVAAHRLDHRLQHRIDERARLFGVTTGQQLHRALDVGEQHGHVLAFALERDS